MKGRRPGRDDQDGLSFGVPVIMFSMRIYDFFSELPIFVIVYHLEFMIKRLLPLLLAVVMSSGCAVLAGLDWDYGHLTNAAGTAITAATMSDEQIDELCRQSVAYADAQTPAAGAVYQQRLVGRAFLPVEQALVRTSLQHADPLYAANTTCFWVLYA